jgi:molybdate transport system ATP-binding protein
VSTSSVEFALRKRLAAFQLDVEFRSTARRIVLFGPSGSGKSLTLQCLAGLLTPDAGRITAGGKVLFDPAHGVNVGPEQRRVGYVPQQAALFPHLSVAQNIGYGLRRAPAGERETKVATLLRLVQLEDFGPRRPGLLSGGEQQRVALARALATDPALMLLDEPFSALDTPVRAALRQELLELQASFDFTWLFVTHDLEEAYQLGDEIAVYQAGRILQSGRREDVFYRPSSVEVARLVGFDNIFPATPAGDGRVRLACGLELAAEPLETRASELGAQLYACIRAEDVRILRKDREPRSLDRGARVQGTIAEERHLGFTVALRFALQGLAAPADLWVDAAIPAYRSLNLATDSRWELFIPAEAVHLVGS